MNSSNTIEALRESISVRERTARAVVEAGWDLNELKTTSMSLEQVFLQLTGDEVPAKTVAGKASEKEISK